MPLRDARESDAAAWQALVENTPTGDFLHDWQWASVASFDGQPQRRFVLEEDDAGPIAIVAAQVRGLSLGRSLWYVPHGPVMDFSHPRAAERVAEIARGLRDAGRRAGAVAVRIEPRLASDAPGVELLESAGMRRVEGHLQVSHTRIVNLGSDEQMLAGLERGTRYSVRRAEREGVRVTTTGDAGDSSAIDELYDLAALTQQRAGFPLRPRERFRLCWQALAGAGRAWIMQARHEGRLIASAMLIVEGGQSFYFLAGSRREQPTETKLFASHALQWALMRHARDCGARRHDLWGVAPREAGPSHRWAGVGMFKKGFGGEEVAWAGMWDLVVDPLAYRLREAAAPLVGLARRLTGRR